MSGAPIARNILRTVVLFVAIAPAASCGSGGETKPAYPVRGRVLVKGAPAAGATVFLRPATGDASPEAWTHGYPRATADENGVFSVSTYKLGDGAPTGEYIVLVQWGPPAEELEQLPDEGGATPDKLKGRYMDPAKSKLRITVEPKDNQLDDFNLE